MTEDEAHEAAGAMIHRGLVEQREYEHQRELADLKREYQLIRNELIQAKVEIKELRTRINYLERW